MKKLYKALAGFQQEVKPIFKGTKAYNYNYADLSAILETINPLMAKHGLGFTQGMDICEGVTCLVTVIFHVESGESDTSRAPIPEGVQLKGMNDFQTLGSGITYLRRYGLSSALGLITDEDKDACGQQEPKEPEKPSTAKQRQEIEGLLMETDIDSETFIKTMGCPMIELTDKQAKSAIARLKLKAKKENK
jgi:hypothetical protein